MTVINAEYEAVKNSDVFFAVLDDSFSAGTVVEIEWALLLDKPIVLMYRTDSDKPYKFKSEYWFAISDAIRRSRKVVVRTFCERDEIIKAIDEGIIREVLAL